MKFDRDIWRPKLADKVFDVRSSNLGPSALWSDVFTNRQRRFTQRWVDVESVRNRFD